MSSWQAHPGSIAASTSWAPRWPDLVVLGTNPWQVPAEALPGVAVDQVWIGGELRH
jgi:hypothetical protein